MSENSYQTGTVLEKEQHLFANGWHEAGLAERAQCLATGWTQSQTITMVTMRSTLGGTACKSPILDTKSIGFQPPGQNRVVCGFYGTTYRVAIKCCSELQYLQT